MDVTTEQIQSLLFMNLVNKSPILSGNMQMNINCGLTSPSESQIVIEAPFYDMKKWKKDKVIIPTGDSIRGKTDYVYWVNEMGGFATHNQSEHWVNRSIYEVALEIASMMGAEIINKLEM